jgi:hypothetical protein
MVYFDFFLPGGWHFEVAQLFIAISGSFVVLEFEAKRS